MAGVLRRLGAARFDPKPRLREAVGSALERIVGTPQQHARVQPIAKSVLDEVGPKLCAPDCELNIAERATLLLASRGGTETWSRAQAPNPSLIGMVIARRRFSLSMPSTTNGCAQAT